MTMDFSTLTTAADKWDDMAGEFKKLEAAYKRDVHKISLGETWRGVAQMAANGRFDATLREYQAAQKEAKAVAAILREAHTQFTDLRGRLKSVRTDAIAAGMKVSVQGYVSYDYDKLTDKELAASRHDPDFASSVRIAESEWSQAIADAVKAFDDADGGVKIALDAAVLDANLLDGIGFNGAADKDKDIEEYEADKAADIATRINSDGNVSAADRAELQRTFRTTPATRTFPGPSSTASGPTALSSSRTNSTTWRTSTTRAARRTTWACRRGWRRPWPPRPRTPTPSSTRTSVPT